MTVRWCEIEGKFVVFVTLIFLLFRTLDAPIRYSLYKLGLTPLSFLPNTLILLVIVLYLFKAILNLRINRSVLFVVVIFCYSVISSYIFIGNIQQTLLGLYGILPFFFGVVSSNIFVDNFNRFKLFIVICWCISVVGIFLSVFITFPWVGFSYERLGVDVEGTREWASFGIPRVAGFSRSSFEAAIFVLIFMMMQLVLTKHKLIRFITLFVSGIVIISTTTKGIIAAYFILTLYILTRSYRALWVLLSILMLAIMIALPVSTLFVHYNLSLSDVFIKFLLASFEDRLLNTWPIGFDLLTKHGSYLLGRGFGGIGGAQQFFEKSIYSAADNLFLYLYVSFGVGSFFVLFHFLKRTVVLARADDTPLNVFFFLLSLSVITFGMTANVIESPLYGYLIGMFFMFKCQVRNEF